MKSKALAILVLIGLSVLTMANLFTPGDASNTINLTLSSVTTSNKTASAQNIESISIHSLQIVTICTNACSNVISASLDGVYFSNILTNSASASSTNLYCFIGYRWQWLKSTFTQTTANGSTNTVNYLGGRQ